MTPKCRILCPTFGGHITFHKLRLLLFNQRWEPSYWQHPLCLYYTPFPGLCQSLPANPAGFFVPERTRDIIEQTPSSRRLAAVHRTAWAVPQGASITCKSPRRRSLKNSLGGDLLCLKSPAAAIGLAARSVSGHRRCLSGFPADALPFCAAVPGAPAVGDPVPAERH